MPNQVETLYQKTRQHPAIKSLVALESMLSYPIPYQNAEKMYLRFLFFGKDRQMNEAGKRKLYRPHARVSVTYPEGQLVEYMALSFEIGEAITRLGEAIGEYPHAAMARLDFKEAKARRTSLFYYTQQIIPLYGRVDLKPVEREVIQAYRGTLEQVAEPPLRPYYETLSPVFFSWLNKISD